MTKQNAAAVSLALIAVMACRAGAQTGWYPLESGTTEDLNSVVFSGPDTGYAVGNGGTILTTIDAGLTWATAPSGVTVDLNDVYFFTQDTGVVVGDQGTILRSTDAGVSWAPVPSGVTDNLLTVAFECNHTNGVAGGSSQTIIHSTDRGRSWEIVQTGFFGGEFNGSHMASNMIGMIGGENSIFQPLQAVTTDGGATWDFHAFYLNGNEGQMNDIHAVNRSNGTGASSVWDGTGAISATTDGGVSWATTMFAEDLRGINFPTAAIGFAVGSSGTILATTDSGASWVPQTSGAAEGLNEVFFPDSLNGFAVGDNGVILKTTTGGILTSVERDSGSSPADFRILANYPNPFNPQTIIVYELADRQPVRLTIYDLLGREITTLVDETKDAGTYQIPWDASGRAGGAYFCRLQTGTSTATRRIMLLR